MLFFQLDFLLLFFIPVLVVSIALRAFGLQTLAPWFASIASFTFLYVFSEVSVAIALFSILVNYFGARHLLVSRDRSILIAVIAANLIVLGYFKYSILVDKTLFGNSLPLTWRIALPLGISFYTFQQIAFVSDVYRGKVTSFSLRTYMLFKLFFPQFIAGPIVHFERVRASYERWPTFNPRSIRFGLTLFAIGMAKKLAGDYFGVIANRGFGQHPPPDAYLAWTSVLAFTFQIYFDFSGYSDMAVGLARVFGVALPFNFNSPYKSRSISEFWRRWHITLSQWLRDYLYIPLGGNRYGTFRTILALMLTMSLGGLWHGASWTFLFWGAAHGALLTIVRYFGFPAPAVLKQLCVFAFVTLTWVLFRSDTMSHALDHYAAMIDFTAPGLGVELQRLANWIIPIVPTNASVSRPNQIAEVAMLIGALIVCLVCPNSQQIALWSVTRLLEYFAFAEVPVLCLAILILATAFISPDTANAFIYFAF